MAHDADAAGSAAAGDVLEAAHAFLARHPSPLVRAFLPHWPELPARHLARPAALPVLRWLAATASTCEASAAPLLRQLGTCAASLAWRQTYSAAELGAPFIDNYGWTELVGPRGLASSDRLACGILVLGPRTHYPSHRHEAYEVYVPLAGTAAWKCGDNPWRERAPGEVIEHASEAAHAMRTAGEPLIALYLWRGGDLAGRARLEQP